jgi:phage N-6-adenine-methyltransferase
LRQLRLLSSLGSDLRDARRAAGLTQADVASRVGISLPTLRQAERGQGALRMFLALADVLGMAVDARGLPPGSHLGQRLKAVRQQRRIGRRILATAAGVSPTTLAAMEGGKPSHLATVTSVASALGLHLRLTRIGAPRSFWTTTAASSAYGDWTTPQQVLERLYAVVGGPFGLDPCSPGRSDQRAMVKARLRYVAEDDGLSLDWNAPTVFMNPPYGRDIQRWVAKAHEEAASGRAGMVIGLLPARCDTGWWHRYVANVADTWMLRGRLAFGDGSQAAPFPSAIVIWSATPDHRDRMALEFPGAWHIPRAPDHDTSLETLAAD